MAHTPGPWKVSDLDVFNSQDPYPDSMENMPSIITDSGDPWFLARMEDGPNPEDDAQLMATSPELLGLLEEAMLAFGHGPLSEEYWERSAEAVAANSDREGYPHTSQQWKDDLLERMSTVIRKARNEN